MCCIVTGEKDAERQAAVRRRPEQRGDDLGGGGDSRNQMEGLEASAGWAQDGPVCLGCDRGRPAGWAWGLGGAVGRGVARCVPEKPRTMSSAWPWVDSGLGREPEGQENQEGSSFTRDISEETAY